MKKFLILLSVVMLFFSCGKEKSTSYADSANNLEAVFMEDDICIYKTASFEEEIGRVNKQTTGTILEVNESSPEDIRVKIKTIAENGKKITGWCSVEKIKISIDDLEKVAGPYILGYSYAEIFIRNCGEGPTEQFHNFFCNIIEEGHKNGIKEDEIAYRMDTACYYVLSGYSDDSMRKIKNPLFTAAKYDYKEVYEKVERWFVEDSDSVIEPYGMTIIECAIKNGSADVLEYILNGSYASYARSIPIDKWKKYQSLASESKNEKVINLFSFSNDISFYEKVAEKLLESDGINVDNSPKKYEWRLTKYFHEHDIEDYRFENAYIKTDDGSKVNMRTEPDVESEKAGSVYDGSLVTVLDMSKETDVIEGVVSNWLKIKSSEGDEGWVFGGFVYAEFDENPKQDDRVLEYVAKFFENEDSFVMWETKVFYEDFSEEKLTPNTRIKILKVFPSDSPYVYRKENYIFPVCVVRTPSGKAGVINSRDISNKMERRSDFTVLCNVVAEDRSEFGSQKMYEIACVYPDGHVEPLFLPGNRTYFFLDEIEVISEYNERTKKNFPIIVIHDRTTSDRYSNDYTEDVYAYTVKEGRMYNYLEFQAYRSEEGDYEYWYDLSFGYLLHRAVYNRNGKTEHERWVVSELWSYGPLDEDPQIYVLKSHEDWVLPEW